MSHSTQYRSFRRRLAKETVTDWPHFEMWWTSGWNYWMRGKPTTERRGILLHNLANDGGYFALKRAAENWEGCRHKERISETCSTAEDYWWWWIFGCAALFLLYIKGAALFGWGTEVSPSEPRYNVSDALLHWYGNGTCISEWVGFNVPVNTL